MKNAAFLFPFLHGVIFGSLNAASAWIIFAFCFADSSFGASAAAACGFCGAPLRKFAMRLLLDALFFFLVAERFDSVIRGLGALFAPARTFLFLPFLSRRNIMLEDIGFYFILPKRQCRPPKAPDPKEQKKTFYFS